MPLVDVYTMTCLLHHLEIMSAGIPGSKPGAVFLNRMLACCKKLPLMARCLRLHVLMIGTGTLAARGKATARRPTSCDTGTVPTHSHSMGGVILDPWFLLNMDQISPCPPTVTDEG